MRSAINIKPSDTINLTFTGGLGILGGLWLIISPFLFGYNSLPVFTVQGQNATLLGIITGIITIGLAGFLVATEKLPTMQTYRTWAGMALVAMGAFLMASPYLFNYSVLKDPLWNLQITGAIFILVAGFVMQELSNRSKVAKNS